MGSLQTWECSNSFFLPLDSSTWCSEAHFLWGRLFYSAFVAISCCAEFLLKTSTLMAISICCGSDFHKLILLLLQAELTLSFRNPPQLQDLFLVIDFLLCLHYYIRIVCPNTHHSYLHWNSFAILLTIHPIWRNPFGYLGSLLCLHCLGIIWPHQ